MRDSGGDIAQTPSSVVVDRRHLLRLAGVGVSGGAAVLLLPTDAAAGWRNIQVRFFNYSGHRFSVEMWGEDGGAFRTHYTRSAKGTIPPYNNDQNYYVPEHHGAAWLDDYFLLRFDNPLAGFASASINFGGTFGESGWGGGSNRRTVDGDELPSQEGKNPVEGVVPGKNLRFRITRAKDSDNAIVLHVSIFDEKPGGRRSRRRKPRRRPRRWPRR